MTMLGSRWCRLRAILAAGTPSPVFSTCVVMGLLLFTEEPIAVNLKMHREIIILKRRILKKVAPSESFKSESINLLKDYSKLKDYSNKTMLRSYLL